MAREIKFRAWDHHHKEMIDSWHSSVLIEYSGFDGGDTFEPMQYTGLKDKNGVDIYEGDIVKLFNDGELEIVEVSFTVDRDFNGWEITPQDVEDGLTVLGNIHESPELLDKQEKEF